VSQEVHVDSAAGLVVVSRDDAVATITLQRPERRNALVAPLRVALLEALVEAGQDPDVRAVVLTGAGGHFCAGQDLAEHAAALAERAERAERSADGFGTVTKHYAPIVRTLATMPKPVVAAVEGTCVGAGFGFVMACDLRVVSTDAVLGTAFSAIGLTCDSGLAHTLPRAVGEARARELVLLGENFTATQAAAWGIALRTAEPGHALDDATALAKRLASGPTAAYAESKRLLADSGARTLDETLDAEAAAQARAGATADHVGAVEAFLAKRRPTFSGR
jgi:2-(1,2-epoxy-1,2-dihydrophenyl)acetyl-CoA isomerase